MSGQYIFELQFKGVGNRENQYVIMDKSSILDFSKLREDLSKCIAEPFLVQYLDDDDDIVSVDTEDEFKEFSKLVKQRSSKGMLLKLIINCKLPIDQSNYCQPPSEQVTEQTRTVHFKTLQNEDDQDAMIQTQNDMTVMTPEVLNEWKLKMKLELKEEILCEMKNHLEATGQVYGGEEFCCEIDSDGNAIPVESNFRQRRQQNKCYKKLEKKEKLESKIDQRLEMLELKKKKLLEKASLRTAVSRRPFIDSTTVGVPFIMSGIATKESSSLSKRVTVGKVFLQVWHVINDGTVAWNNVELRHTWSSPGLEPDELSIKCTPLAPGQEDHITMKFKAPKTVGPLTSYWHFFYQVDSTWQQFGHYVSVTGSCKMPKLPVASAVVARSQDSYRKQNHESKTGHSHLTTKEEFAPIKSDFNKESKQGYVQFPAEQELAKLKAGEEVKVLNDTGLPAAQSSAQLRSAEIAAEMARLAATLQRSVLKPAPAMSTVQTKCLAEDLKNQNPCQVENLLHSGSDSDLNVDNGEDTDPGFVFVDIPTQSPSAESAVELVNSSAKAVTENLTITEEKIAEMKKTEMEKNEKELLEVINNEIGKLVHVEESEMFAIPHRASELQNSKETLKPNPLEFDENDKNGNTIVENTLSAQSQNITTFPQAEPLPQPSGCELSATQAQYSDLAHTRRHWSFPRLDRNVQYPVFPVPVASQPQQHGWNYASHPSPSQPVMYPLPTITPYAKMGNYHQIPNYQMHGSSHPMQWAPSAFPPAMPNAWSNPVLRHPPLGHFGPCTTQVTGVPNGTNSAPLLNPSSTLSSNEAFSPPEQAVTIQSAFNSQPVRNEGVAPAPETIDDASAPQPVPQEQNKKDSPIQILPQALMDGAITVASNAYSTAWNAINTLRPKEGEATEFDPVFENNMTLLAEMGFVNYERNSRLLKRFNNDVNQVIGVICSTGGGNLEID